MTQTLYNVRVEAGPQRQQLLQIVGERDTVLTAALAVILDNAPPFNPQVDPSTPSFIVSVWKVAR